MITENSIISSFNLLLDCGTIEPEDMKTVQNIIMNGRKKELEKIFKEAGCPELLKFTYCPSDERYKLRIPVSIKNKYDLKPAYKARSEEDIINALFNDIHKVQMMSITLDGLYELWKPAMIEKTRQRDRSMHTAAKHIEAYEALVKGTAFGAKVFRTIRHDDFDDFYCTCEGKHITKSRANEIKTTLNKIWEFGKAKGLVEVNHSKEFS
ncbi:MAG: hypothetical protein J5842_00005, partial [Lachnospiraceae bacterium]|nr:hypothetical protein [Lachnospiraceae bacterium]